MHSYCLAMIAATHPTSIHLFIVFPIVVLIFFLVNIWIPCVWQWFQRRTKRAFIHVLFSNSFGDISVVNIWIPCVLQWFWNAPRYRLCIHYFSMCFANICLVNIWIPCVWQWFPLRTQRAFMNLVRFLWFGSHFLSKLMNS